MEDCEYFLYVLDLTFTPLRLFLRKALLSQEKLRTVVNKKRLKSIIEMNLYLSKHSSHQRYLWIDLGSMAAGNELNKGWPKFCALATNTLGSNISLTLIDTSLKDIQVEKFKDANKEKNLPESFFFIYFSTCQPHTRGRNFRLVITFLMK